MLFLLSELFEMDGLKYKYKKNKMKLIFFFVYCLTVIILNHYDFSFEISNSRSRLFKHNFLTHAPSLYSGHIHQYVRQSVLSK